MTENVQPRKIGFWVPALIVMVIVVFAIFWTADRDETPVPVPIDAPDGMNAPLKPPSP